MYKLSVVHVATSVLLACQLIVCCQSIATPLNHNYCKEEVDLDSGWRIHYDSAQHDRCDFDRLPSSDMTPERFIRSYFLQKPVVVTNASSHWPARRNWTKKNLLVNYGNFAVKVGRSNEIVENFGDGPVNMTLQSFVGDWLGRVSDHSFKESLYMFDRYEFVGAHNLSHDFIEPLFYLEAVGSTAERETYFLLGGSQSGVALHMHTDGWNGLIFGEKHWVFYSPIHTPPAYPVYNGHLNWLELNSTKADPPFNCIQHAGDIIYIPEGWYHATVNIGDTVGVAVQLRRALTPYLDKYQKAQRLASQGKHTQAIEKLQQALKLKPSDISGSWPIFEVLNEIGLNLEAKGEISEALNHFELATKVNPGYAPAYYNSGRMYRQLNKIEDAVTSYKKAAVLDSGNPDHFRNLGNALKLLSRDDEAIMAYRRAIQLRPTNSALRRILGNFLRTNFVEEAIVQLQMAVELDPSSFDALNDYGSALAQIGRNQQAQSVLEQAVSMKPDAWVPRLNLGNVLIQLKQFAKAITVLDEAKRLNPTSVQIEQALQFARRKVELPGR